MNQKKKRPAVRRVLSGLLALMLVVTLIQQYPVSAQENEQQVTEQQGDSTDSGSEQDKDVIVTGDEEDSSEGQNDGTGSEVQSGEESGSTPGDENAGQEEIQTDEPSVVPSENNEPEIQSNNDQTDTASSSTEGKAAARISFQAVRAELEDVEVTLEINGTQQEITYPAGLITDNLDALSGYLSDDAVFRRAVVEMPDGSVTDIVRIGTYDGNIYYALNDQQDTGILLADGAKIKLICDDQYTVSYTREHGSFSGPETVWRGDDLNVVITPDDYYHIKSVTYQIGNGESKSADVSDSEGMTLNIPAGEITGDVAVSVQFEMDAPYVIYENEVPNGNAESGIWHGDLCLNDNSETDGTVEPPAVMTVQPGGNDAVFWLYSQSNTGNTEWVLNMLSVNGENVNVPMSYEEGASAETTLSNGTIIRVELIHTRFQINWKGDDAFLPINDKYRTVYQVTITDVKEDMSFEGNFKENSSREMIITGLQGIASIGASSESYYLGIPAGYHFDYGLQPNDGNTVYEAYYHDGWDDGKITPEARAENIYLYSVYPGYNPNTVGFEVYYNGVKMDSEDAIQLDRGGNENPAWMLTVEEMANALTTNYRHFDGFVDAAKSAGYTYCFALKQNDARNQVMRLWANPYQYNLVFDLNDGTFDNTGLDMTKYSIDSATGIMTEKNTEGNLQIYTLENGAVSTNMPLVEPVREGHVFAGWQLYKDGEPVSDTLYSSNQQFMIDENSISNAAGDETKDEGHTFTFVAQWTDVAADATIAGYTVNYYKEDPEGNHTVGGKTYTLYRTTVDSGAVGHTAVILNENRPEGDYEINEANSVRSTVLIDEKDESYKEGESNVLSLYFDVSTYDLTITKDAQGDSDLTKEWEIRVTLKDANGDALEGTVTYGKTEFTDGVATVKLKDEAFVTISGIPTGYKYSIEEINVPVGYEKVQYQINNGSLTTEAPKEVSLTADTEVKVINDRNLEPSDTGIDLGGIATVFGIGVAGIGALVFCLLYLRRRHVR